MNLFLLIGILIHLTKGTEINDGKDNRLLYYYYLEVNNRNFSVLFNDDNLSKQFINNLPFKNNYVKENNSVIIPYEKNLNTDNVANIHITTTGEILYDKQNSKIIIIYGFEYLTGLYLNNNYTFSLGTIQDINSSEDYFGEAQGSLRIFLNPETSIIAKRNKTIINQTNMHPIEFFSKKSRKFNEKPDLYIYFFTGKKLYLKDFCVLSEDQFNMTCEFNMSFFFDTSYRGIFQRNNFSFIIYENLPNYGEIDTGIKLYFVPFTNCTYYNYYVCYQCPPGYYQSSDGEKCIKEIKNCLYIINDNKCTYCNSRYYTGNLVELKCLPFLRSNCIRHKNILTCEICSVRYELADYGACIKDEDGCNLVDPSNNKCKECLTGFVLLDEGKCISSLDYCESYNSDGSCKSCIKGYIKLNEWTCIEEIYRCYSYNTSTGLCSQCKMKNADSEVLEIKTSHNGFCFYEVDFCLEYDLVTGYCKLCQLEYDLTKYHKCAKAIDFCKDYNEQNLCEKCIEGYTISYIDFRNNNRICQKVIKGCTLYHSSILNDCISCGDKYRRNSENDVCLLKSKGICEKYDKLNEKCLECSDEKDTFDNGVCFNKKDNCLIYELYYTKCLKCQEGYELSNSLTCVPQIKFCLKYEGENCVQCEDNYISLSSACVKKRANCEEYNLSGCKKCKSGLSTVNYYCVKYLYNCKTYDYESGNCLECNDKYELIEQRNELFCVDKVDGCISYYFTNKKCGICKEGYNLIPSENICFYIEGCSLYDETHPKICVECQEDYFFYDSKCIKNVLFCEKYNYDDKVCVKCSDDFVLYENNCFFPINNCEKYGLNGECEQCSDGLITDYDPFKCIKDYSRCLDYNINADKCFSCQEGFYYDSKNFLCSTNITFNEDSDSNSNKHDSDSFMYFSKTIFMVLIILFI